MSWQDVRGWYQEAPDENDRIEKELSRLECDFDLSETPCESCGDRTKNKPCYFLSDGGYEPRDGTYLCRKCADKRFG